MINYKIDLRKGVFIVEGVDLTSCKLVTPKEPTGTLEQIIEFIKLNPNDTFYPTYRVHQDYLEELEKYPNFKRSDRNR